MANPYQFAPEAKVRKRLNSHRSTLMTSAAFFAFAVSVAPAAAQIVITDDTPVSNPGGQTVTIADGITQTVASGDNIELEDDTNDGTTIINAGTLINQDADDEDVVIFIDNSEDNITVTNEATGTMRGENGVIFMEGDGLTLTNHGTIENLGNADEGAVYFDRDTDSTLHTVTNTGTV